MKILLADGDCLSPWSKWQCILLTGGRVGTTVGFTLAHCTFVVERAIASHYAHKYERFGARLSAFLVVLSVSFTLLNILSTVKKNKFKLKKTTKSNI